MRRRSLQRYSHATRAVSLLCAALTISSSPFIATSFTPSSRQRRPRCTAQPRLSSSPFDGLGMEERVGDTSMLDWVKSQAPRSSQQDNQNVLSSSPLTTTDQRKQLIETIKKYAIGITFTVGVIYGLAMLGDTGTVAEPGTEADELSKLARNVYVAAVPENANDVIAISLGEGIGAVIGAMATAIVTSVVSAILRLRMTAVKAKRLQSSEDVISEAFADTEYFWTRTGALPLLSALGLNPSIARLSSVALATVPYEVVKWQARKEKQRQAESVLMDKLLEKEQQREEQRFFKTQLSKTKSVDITKLQGIERRPIIDVPEIFSDIIKWLEYDVLKTDFGGQLVMNGNVLGSGAESAAFGFVIALSSQLYVDVIYQYTDFGPDHTTQETRSRTAADWFYLYINRCLGTATLFGVYESVSLPVSIALQGFLSGAVDGCVGSLDFNMCMETFVRDNPPEASNEAQFRSLVTAVVSLWNRLQTEGWSDAPEVSRSVLTQMYNLGLQIAGSFS